MARFCVQRVRVPVHVSHRSGVKMSDTPIIFGSNGGSDVGGNVNIWRFVGDLCGVPYPRRRLIFIQRHAGRGPLGRRVRPYRGGVVVRDVLPTLPWNWRGGLLPRLFSGVEG